MLVVVWLSLRRWDLLGPIQYVGLDNWHSVLSDPTFGNSLLVTLVFIALVVPAQMVLGLLAAALLARELPGSGVFRTIYVLPWVCAPLAIGVLWRWMLAPPGAGTAGGLGGDGVVEHRIHHPVLRRRNPGDPTADSPGRPGGRRRRLAAVLAHHPADAAAHPVLRGGHRGGERAQVFDTVYALTGGGPQNRTDLVAHRIYAEAFGAAAIGRAAVMAIVLFVILVGVTVAQHLYFAKRINYDLA